MLQDAAPTGVRDADPAFWQLRLDALRMANRPDQFDEAAIDYCVTYEVSPPSWEPATLPGAHQRLEPVARTSPPLSVVSDVSTSFVESQLTDDAEHGAGGDASSCRASWSATSAPTLKKLDDELGSATIVNVVVRAADPRRLHRRRRPAELGAGASAARTAPCSFVEAHRLVALFFGAMGINEHAKVKVRDGLTPLGRRPACRLRAGSLHSARLPSRPMETYHGTTIVSVRRGSVVALGGDGQVTLGNIVVKATARKVRRLYHDQVLAGFAGATADAFTLFERFEAKLEKHQGHLVRAAIELTKDWRTDRVLRRLEAMLAVADRERLAHHHRQRRRARARARHRRHRLGRRLRAGRGAGAARSTPSWRRRTSSSSSLEIAGDLCIYTNQNHTIETLDEPHR